MWLTKQPWRCSIRFNESSTEVHSWLHTLAILTKIFRKDNCHWISYIWMLNICFYEQICLIAIPVFHRRYQSRSSTEDTGAIITLPEPTFRKHKTPKASLQVFPWTKGVSWRCGGCHCKSCIELRYTKVVLWHKRKKKKECLWQSLCLMEGEEPRK